MRPDKATAVHGSYGSVILRLSNSVPSVSFLPCRFLRVIRGSAFVGDLLPTELHQKAGRQPRRSLNRPRVSHNQIVGAWNRCCLLAVLLVLTAAPLASAPPADPEAPSVLISRQLLRDAHLAVGDVVLLSADRAGAHSARFRIAGVYEPTPDPLKYNVERLEARLHLPDLIRLTANPADPQSAESVTAVNVKLVNPADADSFAADVARRSIGLVARPTARAR